MIQNPASGALINKPTSGTGGETCGDSQSNVWCSGTPVELEVKRSTCDEVVNQLLIKEKLVIEF